MQKQCTLILNGHKPTKLCYQIEKLFFKSFALKKVPQIQCVIKMYIQNLRVQQLAFEAESFFIPTIMSCIFVQN